MTIDQTPVHIGDGAYLSFDGWQFWLGANSPSSRLVALEPTTFWGLLHHMGEHPAFRGAMEDYFRSRGYHIEEIDNADS